ncbi:MAG: cytochrome C oxidase subunit III [Bdellovibrionaceae bacterium]|nr:cytochrome C oxidase subunit III [Pseudobdellovibrionaceae bacterium]
MSTGSVSSTEHHHAHHFNSAEHEFDASMLGIWLFLCTEILMFGGLFVAFFIYHAKYPEVFAAGAATLDWKLGALNTIILLISSYTMAMGIHSCQTNKGKKAFNYLAVTFVCGLGFMVIKAIEYSGKIGHGFLPGKFFHPHDATFEAANQALYYSFYFMMTGLHGLHVIIGMGLIAWVAIRAKRGDFSSKFYTPVEGVGLFWHLVDLVWIYLFPLLYLVG